MNLCEDAWTSELILKAWDFPFTHISLSFLLNPNSYLLLSSPSMIHPTAIISDQTTLWKNVIIWPYAVLEWTNTVADDCEIMAHAWMRDSTLGTWTMLTPFAKIDKTSLGNFCKIGAELRKCHFGDRVQASHTNIVLEWTTIAWYTNVASGTVFWIWWGEYDADGGYIKGSLSIGTNVFVGLNSVFFPGRDQKISIGNDVYIAGDLEIRHDIPDAHTVYPRSLVEHLQTKWTTFDVVKMTESYAIINRNKMKEEGIMKHW